MGGKSQLAKRIVQYFPSHKTYIEACIGAGHILWAKPKETSAAEIVNDVDGELINFYQVLHKHGRKLAFELDSMPYSRQLFRKMRDSKPRSAFKRAARFWYLNRVCFGGKSRGQTFGVVASRQTKTLPASIVRSVDSVIERLRGVTFESIHLSRLLQLYDRGDALFYLDPPYWGLSQSYAGVFGQKDHVKLAQSLAGLKGSWILSSNDCKQIRSLYKGFSCRKLRLRYTIGCNSSTSARDRAAEIIVSNQPLVKHRLATSASH
jgi:DNA adenine methylase